MDIRLSCHHTTATPALRQAVTTALERLARHSDQPLVATVVLTVHPKGTVPGHQADATVLVNGDPHHASATELDMYVALDRLAGKLDRMLRKAKTARLSRRAQLSHPPDLG